MKRITMCIDIPSNLDPQDYILLVKTLANRYGHNFDWAVDEIKDDEECDIDAQGLTELDPTK